MLRGTLRLLAPLALALPATAQIFVPGDYPDLQAAIDGASPGAVILVSGETGPVVVDKPLKILGNPTFHMSIACAYPFTLFGGSDGFRLTGPGSGAVVLANFTTDGKNCADIGSAITGGGFDELHVLNASIELTEDHSLDGTATGNHGIAVDVPLLLISGSSVRGAGSDHAPGMCSHVSVAEAAGIHAPNSQVILLDSTVTGGETSSICCLCFDCPPLPDPFLGGAGGAGVVCDALFLSSSEVEGGQGARYQAYPAGTVYDPWGVPLDCGQQPDGPDLVVSSYHALYSSLAGPPTAALGDVYPLTTSLGGYGTSLAWLFAALAPGSPQLSSQGWVFLDPATTVLLGQVSPSFGGPDKLIPFPVPPDANLLGLELAFQAIDGNAGLTRPVFAVVVP